jgi:hypothetical protein
MSTANTAQLDALQLVCLPAALGTFAIVYSSITGMMAMSKIRYAKEEKFEHPYQPWKEDDPRGFRAFKAFGNMLEWTVFSVPCLWLYVLYTPAIPCTFTSVCHHAV